jgi:phosphoribosylglycinamide formyltransferase-1
MIHLGVLASTKGTDMQAVIDAIKAGTLDARISCVISNRPDNYALERARNHGIEAIFVNPKDFGSREEFDAEIAKELNKRNIDLVLLIGYMRILSRPFVEAFRNRAMNIHPSLLPAFAGGMDSDVHEKVIESGVKFSGCTLHFISEDVDEGPIILQKIVNVDNNETPASLKEKVQKAEQETIIEGIRLFKEGRIVVDGKRVKLDI